MQSWILQVRTLHEGSAHRCTKLLQEILLRVCCSMLLCLRSRLLAGDFTTNLKLLQHYPSVDINHLLKVADDLKNWSSSRSLVHHILEDLCNWRWYSLLWPWLGWSQHCYWMESIKIEGCYWKGRRISHWLMGLGTCIMPIFYRWHCSRLILVTVSIDKLIMWLYIVFMHI